MIQAGEKYRHFKGSIMEVAALCKHLETLEDLVIYKYGENLWGSPILIFK